MALADEIARVRSRARGAEINARHRRSKEKAEQIRAAMVPAAPANGVHPNFARSLEQARARVKEAESKTSPRNPTDRIEQLVREGKLPPRTGDGGVGYEPTAEEILGDLGEPTAPEGTEDLPDAATVLAAGAPDGLAGWDDPPGAPAPRAVSVAPGAPALAQPAAAVQSKRKRGK